MTLKNISRLLSAITVSAIATLSFAQEQFPTKPVVLVVPFTPGGTGEALFRPLAKRLSERWKQPVLIDNKPGANGLIGTQYVMRAPGDGHTLLFHVPGILQNALLMKDAKYDPFKSFKPIISIGSQPLVLATSAKSPYRNLAEFIEAGRKPNANFSYGSIGAASTYHIYGELLANATKVDMPHVAYKGTAPMMMDLLAQRISVGFVTANSGVQYRKDDGLRPLAVNGTARLPALPDVPTLAELGYKGFEQVGWYGIFVPASTPDSLVAKISSDIGTELKSPEMSKILEGLYIMHADSDPASFGAIMRNDYQKWAELIKRFDIKLE